VAGSLFSNLPRNCKILENLTEIYQGIVNLADPQRFSWERGQLKFFYRGIVKITVELYFSLNLLIIDHFWHADR
jgi:hypothetical protein